MTDVDAAQIKQQAFGAPKPEATAASQQGNGLGLAPKDDLSGTDEKLDLQQDAADETGSRRRKVAKPGQTIEEAIDDGRSISEIEALEEKWNAYNRQEALKKISDEKRALAERIEAGRRKFADQLLAIADEFNVSIAEARDLLRAALKRKYPSGAKPQ